MGETEARQYAVTLRGIAEQIVYVKADSPSEAREKARHAEFEGATGYPDWVRNPDGSWRHWPAREPVEEI